MPKKPKKIFLKDEDAVDDEKEIDGVEDDEEDELAAAGMHIEDEDEKEEDGL